MNLETGLIITLLAILVWLITLTIVLLRMVVKYYRLTKGIKKKELISLLENTQSRLEKQKQVTDEQEKWLQKIEKDAELHLQKIGFVRFSPFTDTGGNQSFCLALLDQNNDGIVLSSLHSREQTRIYAKAIIQGKAKGFELSKEEQEALKRARSRIS